MSSLDESADAMRAVLDTCVWSQQETHRSLVPYLVEESAEVVDAIESGTRDDLLEELGDLLWQVLFHAEIARRTPEEAFGIDEVAARLTQKMVHRHPHVFAGETAETPEDVMRLWTAAKKSEKRHRTSVLDGVPKSMASLALAGKLLGKAASVGAEAPEPADAAGRVPSSQLADEAALGELLLGIAAAARARGLDPERALRERLRLLEADIRAAEQPR